MRKIVVAVCSLFLLLQSCTYESVEPVKVVTDSVISYSLTIAPLTNAKCSGCHGAGSPDGDFSTYPGLKGLANDGGILYNRVVMVKDMPQAGSGITLTDQERSYYAAWIKQGALNN